MIQKWVKTHDASNNLTWEKKVVATSNANNIVVTNPTVTNQPASLNSVLGKMKSNINELYGNVKWLALHGGGGAGNGGGNGPSSSEKAQIKIYGDYNGNSETDLVASGVTTVSVNTDSYSVAVRLLNGETGVDYTLVVRNNKKQIYSKVLNRGDNRAEIEIKNLSVDKYANLTFVITDSYGYSDYDSPTLSINYASVKVDAYLYVVNSSPKAFPINSTQSSMQRDVNSGYRVYFYVTPTANGIIRWNFETNINTVDDENFALSGVINNVEAGVEYRLSDGGSGNWIDLKNELVGSNFSIGRFFTASMTVRLFDMAGVELSRQVLTFSPSIIPEGDFYIVPSNSYWNETSTEEYNNTYFDKGNNVNLDLIVGGDSDKFPNVFIVPKVYFETNSGEWERIENNAIQYGVITPQDDEENYFPNQNYNDTQKYRFLTENSVQVKKWKEANKDRLISDIESTGVRTSIVVPYSILENNYFTHDRDGVSTKFANIKIDLYVVAIDETIKDNENLLLPLDSEGNYTYAFSFKAQVEESKFRVPNYVSGVEKGVRKSGGVIEYTFNKSMYFNLDSINLDNVAESKINSINSLVDASYNNTVVLESGQQKTIPMQFNGTNGITSGLIRNKSTDYYLTLRTSGDSYGFINSSVFNREFLNKGSRDFSGLSNGFSIELAFKTDEHPTNKGTIFSMGDYSFDGELTAGINVDLEEAKFVVSNSTTGETTTATVQLSQNTFYQLDFVYELRNADESNRNNKDTAIIKIYKNGIPTAVASIKISNTAGTGYKYNVNFGSSNSDVCFGCKSIENTKLKNYCDVNFYGVRFYGESLTEQEVLKNWMISKSCINQKDIPSDGIENRKELDWENVINPMLISNFYDNEWHSTLWNYITTENRPYTQPADGETLFEEMGPGGWKYDELKKEYYRPLPVVHLKVTVKGVKNADVFYESYDESQASVNNKYIENEDWTNVYQGEFQYFDTNYQNAIENPNVTVAWFMQGTSTQGYRSKNLEVAFVPNDSMSISGDLDTTNDNRPLFTPNPKTWLPENRFTLKADMVDSAHANNAAIGKWINSSGFMPLNPAQQDLKNPYRGLVKSTLEGFPCLVFIDWGDSETGVGTEKHSGTEFLGIYSFNLGRGSFFNLGFKILKEYELAANSKLSVNASVDELVRTEFENPQDAEHASFVRRYRAYPPEDNPNIYSFECATNEPDTAVGFGQPNPDMLQKIWDMKYNSGPKDVGYARLCEIIKNFSYINSDKLNYWSEEGTPKYYYALSSEGTFNSPLYLYRNPNDFNDNLEEIDVDTKQPNPDGTFNSIDGKKTGLVRDYMRWYEGLNRYHGTRVLFRSDGTIQTPVNSLPDRQPEYSGFDVYSLTASNLGVGDNDEGSFKPSLEFAPMISDEGAKSSWIHYGSFSRYFVIAYIFGMIDSLGKNLTLRSWNIKDKDTGTIVPAFYDMDTALGLDNRGTETIDPTVSVDYWINNNTVSVGDEAYPLIVITENTPYVDTSKTVMFDFYGDGNKIECYNWYDRSDEEAKANGKTKVLIGCYPKDGNTLPMPSTVRYNLNNSHLWHIIRFMPSILARSTKTITPWTPLGQYGILRGDRKFMFNDVDTFFNEYYMKQNEKVGEFIFSLDYKEKYMRAYKVSGSDDLAYNDLMFCHGRRDDFVKNWLKKRISFLDSIWNLRQSYTGLGSVTMGPESLWTGSDYYNTEIAGNSSVTPYLEGLTSNQVAINGRTSNAVIRGNVVSNITTVLLIKISNTFYRFFLRANVPSRIACKEPSSKISVHINNISTLTTWENFKDLKLTIMNDPWRFAELDLSGQASLTGQSSDAFNLNGMVDMKVCNLQGFQTEEGTLLDLNLSNLIKLEKLNLSNSCFKSVSLPNGGNMKELIIRDSKLTGKISLANMMSLEGTVDFTNIPGVREIEIANCPKLKGVIFSQNVALEKITISDCPSLTSFSYSGQVSLEGVESGMKEINIINNCKGISTISVSGIGNEDLKLDFSGATGLSTLSLSALGTTNMPILPDYYVNGEAEEILTNYSIYNSSKATSITLNNVEFKGFQYGKGNERAVVAYQPSLSYGEYPQLNMAQDEASVRGWVILNLAVFEKIGYLNINKCRNIRYIACNPDNTVTNISLNSLSNLERVFGKFSIWNDGQVFGYKNLTSFHVNDWVSPSGSDIEIKEMYEKVLDGSKTVADFEELMVDVRPNQRRVQGILPMTRFTLSGNVYSLENAFSSTNVSMNDVYYIMMVVNLYNKEHETISALDRMFNDCQNIITEYTKMVDKSPSRYLFKYLYTVRTLTLMFGNSKMMGVLYSPDYKSVGENGILTEDKIGTLTPLVKSATSFNAIGWSLSMFDNYAFWTPKGTSVYYNNRDVYTGRTALSTVRGILSNVRCIECAIYGQVDSTETSFDSKLLMKPFLNATTVINSFNSINIDFTEGNETNEFEGNVYTHSTLLKGASKLTSILNSFNCKLAGGTIVVDIFAGNPYSLQNEPNEYPNGIERIEGSFNFETPGNMKSVFLMTDDMFQRISSALKVVSPVYSESGEYNLDNSQKGTFSGYNVIKTYGKYRSKNTVDEALFPYAVFHGCSVLEQAPSFFSDLDLRYVVNALDKQECLTYSDVIDATVKEVQFGQKEYRLEIPVPDYYSSRPYCKVKVYNGNVQHESVVRMFKDCSKLYNISSMFNRMISARMHFTNSNGEKRYIPGSFCLVSDAFDGMKDLLNVQYLFADNHYFNSYIPYSLLSTGTNSIEKLKNVKGSNDLKKVYEGLRGFGSVLSTNFQTLREDVLNNNVPKGNGGLVSIANNVYGGFVYIMDPDEYNDAYIVKTEIVDGVTYIVTREYNGLYYPEFIPCDFSNQIHRNALRYKRVPVSGLPWYQTYDRNEVTAVFEETKVETVRKSKNITNMSYLFYKNDAAGFMPLRYSNEFDNYTNVYSNPSATDTEYLKRSDLYKWNSYDASDFIHTFDSSYNNENLFALNPDYNPYLFIENTNKDIRVVFKYESMTDKDKNSVSFLNFDYDPRNFVVNDNTNKIAFNKFVMDGHWIEDDELETLCRICRDEIVPSDSELKSGVSDDYVMRHIPEKWLNKDVVTNEPLCNVANQDSGIFYASESVDGEMTVSDVSLRAIADNEIAKINEMKKGLNYFCPSDIFNYVSETNGNIKFAFANTCSQPSKVNTSKYQKKVYDRTSEIGSELTRILADSIKAGNSKDINSVGYYLEGNPYSGLTGRVSPMLFDENNKFISIEGIFNGNPNLKPYSYSATSVDNKGNVVYKNGKLFEKDTFVKLVNLKNTYLLWANNNVPRQVNIDPRTFAKNKNIQYLDYMFSGTLWFSTSEDVKNYGSQIPNGIFKGIEHIKSARATFSAPVNFAYNIDESPTISYISNITNGDPVTSGEFGELGNPIGIGRYGAKWVPNDLFEDSSTELQMVSNMFFFDRNLTNYPDIYNYNSFKNNNSANWNAKMYHTAYYLNGSILENNDVIAFGPSGQWQLRQVESSKDNGNKVYYSSGSYSSQLM